MPTTSYGQIVDYYEDGQDSSLASGFTENDPDGIISIGTNSRIEYALATIENGNTNIRFNGTVSSHMRVGCRFLSGSNFSAFEGLMPRLVIRNGADELQMLVSDGRSAGDNTRQIGIRIVGTTEVLYTCEDAHEYAVRIEYYQNNTSSIELIDMSTQTVVASTVGAVTDSPPSEISFGGISFPAMTQIDATVWYNDLIVDSSAPTEDLVFWATSSEHSVVYDANGGTDAPTDLNSPYEEDETVTVLEVGSMTRSGYVFSSWNTSADGSGTSYYPTETFTMPAEDVTLYAIWSGSFTVTYNSNGGTGSQADENTYSESDQVTVLGAGTVARSGYKFHGWYAIVDNGRSSNRVYTYLPGDVVTITEDITLYARWVHSEPVTLSGRHWGWELTELDVGLSGKGLAYTDLTLYTGPSKPDAGTTITRQIVQHGLDLSNGDVHLVECLIRPASGTVSLGTQICLSYDNNNDQEPAPSSVSFTDCEFDGTLLSDQVASFATAFHGNGTLSRCNIHGCGSGIALYHAGSTVQAIIEDNVIHDLRGWGDPATTGSHNDGFTIRDYTNSTLVAQIRGNSILTDSGNDTGACFLQPYGGAIDNVLIEGNLLAGSGYNFQIEGSYNGYGTNIRFRNNRMSGPTYGVVDRQTMDHGLAEYGANHVYSESSLEGKGSILSGSSMDASDTRTYYQLSYNGNTNDGGLVPETSSYHSGGTVSVSSNPGSLVKAGNTFSGWNTAANGSGTDYDEYDTFSMPDAEVELFAIWTIASYHIADVTRDKNGDPLGSCEVLLFKGMTDETPEFIDRQTSNATTGEFDFTGLDDNDADYCLVSYKTGSPNVMDVSDINIQPVLEE